MAQAYINRVIQKNPNGKEQLQIGRLRNDDFNDSDDNLLVQAAIDVENRLKRKRIHKKDRAPIKKAKLVCQFCEKNFQHKCSLIRHEKAHNSKCECNNCGKNFSRKYNLQKHLKKCSIRQTSTKVCENKDNTRILTCKHCGIGFNDVDALFTHVADNHPINQSGGNLPKAARQPEKKTEATKRFRFHKEAINDTVHETDLVPIGNEKYDLLQFLANVKDDVERELSLRLQRHRNIKWYVNVRVEMVRDIDDGQRERAHPHFRSRSYILLQNENNDHNLNEAFQAVNKALEEFIAKGSNWVLNKIICIEIHTVQYSPVAGSSFMELPPSIRYTKGVVNIQNDDQKCFLWSVLAAIHPASDHPNRVYHYKPFEHELNMKDIQYPVSLAKMEKFEKQNNISVNVFGYENNEVFPLYLSKMENGCQEVDLLYLSKDDKNHYCWIKNLDHFLGSTTRFNSRRYYCRRCLHGFIRRDLLDKHRIYCQKFEFQRVTYPEEGKNDILEFKDFHKSMRVPFVIYADFECYSKQLDTALPTPNRPSTTHITKFEACGYAYVVVSSNDKYSKPPVVYRGDDAVQNFFENMFQEEDYITNILNDPEPLIMNEETERSFQNATHCYICNQMFSEKNIKVRDHDHLGMNGNVESPSYSNYRGTACQKCNLNLRNPPFIPVYFHNLRNFDAHLLLSEAGKYKHRRLSCIPNNMEKYISFSSGKLRFVDSYQCMNSSLETLVDNMAADGLTHFKQFRKAFPEDDIAQLLLQKNEFCYSYIQSSENFKETSLPPREAFYNEITKEDISDEKYEHATKVWSTFNMKNLGEFHDLYVLTDTLLLADVFERFRDMTMEYYKLDASHFFTSPGLAWQAALKMSGICLDLITDPLMYNMIELGTRGGISMVTKKYSHANHQYLNEWDNTREEKYLMYLDANNLYGWAMCQPLPFGFMHFLTQEEIEKFNLQKVSIDAKEGYILEVDLEYPEHLHDDHNCYPLAPEHLLVDDCQLSQYSLHLWEKINNSEGASKPKPRVKTRKLIPTLNSKKNYVIHYRNLQLYADLGMKTTKIHRILAFQQRPWLKTYIDFNTDMRKKAKNDFEKDFFKLMCNSVFGKCLENLRERSNISLINTEEKLKKRVAKPSFIRCQIFNEDLVGVHNRQTNLLLNKPIYVGQTILDLSKWLMYDFHYKVMKPKYENRLRLLFTDTDSLCYEIETKDVYKDMESIKHLLDTSNYGLESRTSFLFSAELKKKVGVFKDELSGIPLKEFVGLRPKMYSLLYDEKHAGDGIYREKEKRVAKGISKCEIKKTLRHRMYKECLFDERTTTNSMKCIRSKNHELYLDNIVKKGLCSFDDKRFWKNAVESYAFGHYKIND